MEFYVQFSLNCYIIRSSRTGISALRKSFIKRKSNLRKRRVLKVANKTLIGSYPAIKILILLNLYYINYVGIKKYSKKLRGY